ncbi:Alpha/Beta hydrolase protein [Paraphysoderma sedebokerense]|nr:Alpha/Beta hydrolase protein [Paraphysoderma sedebokerense]
MMVVRIFYVLIVLVTAAYCLRDPYTNSTITDAASYILNPNITYEILEKTHVVVDEAKEIMNYAAVSYCPPQVIKLFKCKICHPRLSAKDYLHIIRNDSMSVLAFIRYDANLNDLIVSFRGTVNDQNWKQNLQVKLVKYEPLELSKAGSNTSEEHQHAPKDAKVHVGYWKAFVSIRQSLVDSMEKIWAEKKNVSHAKPLQLRLTGHSYGGALAGLGALQLQSVLNLTREQILVYTINQPRVGNEEFVEFYDSRIPTFRIVHGNDAVSKLPPETLGYVHYGSEVFDDLNGTVHFCKSGMDKRCSRKYYSYSGIGGRHNRALNMNMTRCGGNWGKVAQW